MASSDDFKIRQSHEPYRIRKRVRRRKKTLPVEGPIQVSDKKPEEARVSGFFEPSFKKIMIPTDLSAACEPAYAYGAGLGLSMQATVYLVYILDVKGESRSAQKLMHQQAHMDLEHCSQTFFPPELSMRYIIGIGQPAQFINTLASKKQINLIIMATHGRKGLAHFLLGSVTEQVIREAPCPVLSLRPY